MVDRNRKQVPAVLPVAKLRQRPGPLEGTPALLLGQMLGVGYKSGQSAKSRSDQFDVVKAP